jgi:hypothetical protein
MKKGYEHWNEEADRIAYKENDPDSKYADMSDEEIKQAVYDRMNDEDHDEW